MNKSKIDSFNFPEGKTLAGGKYQVVAKLGSGWEGEVYTVRETMTGIERAAKFFFPERNKRNKSLIFYAKKLHKLRNCSILIQYATQETLWMRGEKVSFLVSDFVEGEPLHFFLERQSGKRLPPFQAVHLLHSLAKGLEEIHNQKEYHGDLHTENVIVQRVGLGYDLKVIDMFQWGAAKPINIHEDVVDLIRVFYDSLGGKKHYAKMPDAVKDICCGLKKSLILKKFKTAGQLRYYLEQMTWE
jgi:serine/threonine protein kinase